MLPQAVRKNNAEHYTKMMIALADASRDVGAFGTAAKRALRTKLKNRARRKTLYWSGGDLALQGAGALNGEFGAPDNLYESRIQQQYKDADGTPLGPFAQLYLANLDGYAPVTGLQDYAWDYENSFGK